MTDRSDVASGAAGETLTGSPFKNWTAILDLQPIVQPDPLRVSGLYRLDQRCGSARLQVAEPQGINPRILILDLITTLGEGGEWIPVEDRFAANEGQYDSVEIRDGEGRTVLVDIQEVH